MDGHRSGLLLVLMAALSVAAISRVANAANESASTDHLTLDKQQVEQLISQWPDRPRLGVAETMASYGPPQEMTDTRAEWRDAGQFKRITVFREEVPHDFPIPHVDFLEDTISYQVPEDKVGDVLAFDGSSTINRTAGELSARSDLEAHNLLMLNLAHDIATGTKSVAQARREFADNIRLEALDKPTVYVQSLQFRPEAALEARFSDTTVIPGAPVRAIDNDAKAMKKLQANGARRVDAEVLARIVAIDMNEINAATVAENKNLRAEMTDYARKLHEEHGENLVKALQLAQRIDLTPVDTASVAKIRNAGAGSLAELAPLEGSSFEESFLDAMIQGHTDALRQIDGMIQEARKVPQLKKFLAETRKHVSAHLRQAEDLQAMR